MPHWLWERLGGWARRAAAAVLVAGGRPVPRHIAFIMDGNRRFAEARSLRKVEGHAFGYRRLIDALEWCLELGVRCVSVYAFSIDNYRRSGEEVATLMQLAQEKLAHMLQECDVLTRHGVQVRVIGDLSLAPREVQAAAAAVMAATAHHDRAVLNLCFSYTASEELLHALDSLAASGSSGSSGSNTGPHAAAGSNVAAASAALGSSGSSTDMGSSPSAADLDQHLYTAGCPPVDLLVRTSGETRLSDFLLWQSRHALLIFTPVLWPDFGFADLVAAIMQFQRHSAHLQRLRCAAAQHQASAAALVAAAAAGAPGQLQQQTQQREHQHEQGCQEKQQGRHQPPPPPQQQQQWDQQRDQQQQRNQQQQREQQRQRLRPVKVAPLPEQRQQGSPCSIASPASPSSPSSRSEASAEEAPAAAAAAEAAQQAASLPAALPLRKRHAVEAAAAGVVL
ncbi:hypothetical protein ABPG75_007466 [Micractinium tetrahymenae]